MRLLRIKQDLQHSKQAIIDAKKSLNQLYWKEGLRLTQLEKQLQSQFSELTEAENRINEALQNLEELKTHKNKE